MDNASFGLMLRRARQAAGYTTVAALSRACGVSCPTISDAEHGRSSPSIATLRKIFEPIGWRVIIAFEPMPKTRRRMASRNPIGAPANAAIVAAEEEEIARSRAEDQKEAAILASVTANIRVAARHARQAEAANLRTAEVAARRAFDAAEQARREEEMAASSRQHDRRRSIELD